MLLSTNKCTRDSETTRCEVIRIHSTRIIWNDGRRCWPDPSVLWGFPKREEARSDATQRVGSIGRAVGVDCQSPRQDFGAIDDSDRRTFQRVRNANIKVLMRSEFRSSARQPGLMIRVYWRWKAPATEKSAFSRQIVTLSPACASFVLRHVNFVILIHSTIPCPAPRNNISGPASL